MISCLFFAQMPAAQESASISLDLPILPLHSILREMEAKTGQVYKVSGPDPEQRLYINIRDFSVERLRAALAEVTQGKWIYTGQTYTLETVSESLLIDKGYRDGVARWQKAQKPLAPITAEEVAQLQKESSDITAAAETDITKARQLNAFSDKSPSSRLVRKLVAHIPLEEMTAMQNGERKVFSLNPTMLQKALDHRAQNDWSAYLGEIAIFKEKALLFPQNTRVPSRFWNPMVDPFREGNGNPPLKTFFVCLRREGAILSASVKTYVDGGFLGGTNSITIGGTLAASESGKPQEQNAFDALAGLEETVVTDPEDEVFSADIAKLRNSSGRTVIETSELTKERLANMDKVDPLLYGPTRMMRQFAGLQNKNIVAKVIDLSFLVPALASQPGEKVKMRDALRYSMGAFDSVGDLVKSEADLITLRPRVTASMPFPLLMNRKESAKFLRSAWKGGSIVDALAILCAGSQSTRDVLIPSLLASLYGESAMFSYEEDNFNMLKLYGLLTPQQREEAKRSKVVISMAGLNPAMSRHVQKMLLWSERGIGVLPPSQDGADISDNDDGSSDGEYSFRDYEHEPTVALTRASLPHSTITISFSQKDRLMMQLGSPGGTASLQHATTDNVAWQLYLLEASPGRERSMLLGFQQGEQRRLKVVFDLAGAGSQTREISMPKSKGGSLMKFDELPEEFRQAVLVKKGRFRSDLVQSGNSGALKPP